MRSVTVTRELRDALRADLLLDITGIGDIHRLLRAGRFTDAQSYRRRFEDDTRLLDDLGWEEDDERESFELTMPPEQLERVLGRLWRLAGEDLACLQRELGVERHPWRRRRGRTRPL